VIPECALCRLVNGEVRTRLYYKDSLCLIVDCDTCHIPMLVFRSHRDATPTEKALAENIIIDLFEFESIRTEQRKIKEHQHWHIEGAKLVE